MAPPISRAQSVSPASEGPRVGFEPLSVREKRVNEQNSIEDGYRGEEAPLSMRTKGGRFRAVRAAGALAAIAMSVAVVALIARRPITIRMEDTPLGGIYDPATLTVRVGTTVQWKNAGQQVHDATDRAEAAMRASDVAYPSGAKPFDSGPLQPGQTYSYTFTVSGTYKYICTPHEFGGMTGEVIVTK